MEETGVPGGNHRWFPPGTPVSSTRTLRHDPFPFGSLAFESDAETAHSMRLVGDTLFVNIGAQFLFLILVSYTASFKGAHRVSKSGRTMRHLNICFLFVLTMVKKYFNEKLLPQEKS